MIIYMYNFRLFEYYFLVEKFINQYMFEELNDENIELNRINEEK
jgi:hypothetical protein